MQVQPIRNYSQNNNPSFTHWNRTVYKLGTSTGIENIIRRNNTHFFRDADFWLDLIPFLEKKFKDISKFQIYSYGCSDGSDALTLIISMLANKRDNILKKFSPIIAKDIDPVAIERAKASIYEIIPSEKKEINSCTLGKFDEFFQEFKGESSLVPEANMMVKPQLSNHVRYSEANILEDYRTIEPNNSIVLVRNVLPYITSNYDEPYYKGGDWQVQKEFLENLYNHLGENSYIAIGTYDRYEMGRKLSKMLREIGFIKTPIYSLYKRGTQAEKALHNTFLGKALEFFQKLLD